MKLDDIKLGQKLMVSHIPEYILSNDGISKILCKSVFPYTTISKYIGKTGEVSVMWFGEKCPHIGVDLFDAPPIYFPPEALSPALQHFPSNNDIQIGDFIRVDGLVNTYKVIEIYDNKVIAECVGYNFLRWFDRSDIISSIRPAPKKDQLTIGAACVTTPDAVDFDGTPIPNMLGIIKAFDQRDDTIYVSWANNTVGWIKRKYIIQL